jgi:acetoacetate decarboxylase
MLKGFMVPRSALGHASIDPAPPWHYSGDVLAVEFWADPAVTASMLPQGLSADPNTNGHAFAMFIDWQFTASNDEYLDPARYQYREAFVLIDAQLGNRAVMFCPFIYVDNDAALARGWAQGFPKKLGSIYQTRTYAAPSAAASQVGPGARFGASVSAHGQRLADARVTLREPVADPFTVFNRPTALVRYFPRIVKGQYDKPAVNELTVSITDNLKLVDLWRGEGQLSFPQAHGEELHTLGPVKAGAGFRYGLSYSVTDLEIVKDFTK